MVLKFLELFASLKRVFVKYFDTTTFTSQKMSYTDNDGGVAQKKRQQAAKSKADAAAAKRAYDAWKKERATMRKKMIAIARASV